MKFRKRHVVVDAVRFDGYASSLGSFDLGDAVIQVEGISGYYLLSRVTAITESDAEASL